LSTDEIVAAHFPIVSLSIISGIAIGVAGIFFKLREIAKDNRSDRDNAIKEKLDVQALAEKLESIIEQQNKKIERLENIIFKLPQNNH
jgi:hypothetical protein